MWYYSIMENKKIAILTDSSCDINDEMAKELDIHVLRMPIVVDGKSYIEGVDIDLNGLKELFKAGKFAKTSQSTLGDLVNKYEELLKEYDEIIHIPLSSGLSGMYQTAYMLAQNYDNRIVVVDAKHACYPVTLLCLEAKKLLKEGKDIFEIKELIEKHAELTATIIPQDINYLKLGGRITAAAASLANLLKIVPILLLKNGVIDVYDKVRTEKRAIQRGIEPLLDTDNYSDYYWMIIHDERLEEAEVLKAQLEEITKEEVSIQKFGPVILSHTGPGTLAFGRIRKIINDKN